MAFSGMINVKTGQLTLGGQFEAYKRGQLERNIQNTMPKEFYGFPIIKDDQKLRIHGREIDSPLVDFSICSADLQYFKGNNWKGMDETRENIKKIEQMQGIN